MENIILFGALIGAGVGALMGLFPLIIGLMFDRTNLAISGIIACLVAGAILGLIAAFPTSLGFTVYIASQVRNERKLKNEAYEF